MKRLFAAVLFALSAPAAAIPPALPPADTFRFDVDGVWITCRLPDPGTMLTGCLMQDSLYLLSITVQRIAEGAFRYDIGRTCLVPDKQTDGFEFAYRSGTLAPGDAISGSTMERDLRALLELRTKPECETLANWPHQISQLVPRLERAFAVYRSLRS